MNAKWTRSVHWEMTTDFHYSLLTLLCDGKAWLNDNPLQYVQGEIYIGRSAGLNIHKPRKVTRINLVLTEYSQIPRGFIQHVSI